MAGSERFDLPGTYVFDGATSRRGYRMNKMFMSLRDPVARERFRADEAAYCAEFGLTDEQRRAVIERDWQAMLDLGGSIFYVYKLAMMDGKSMQYLGGVFTGMSEEEFTAALRARGDSGGASQRSEERTERGGEQSGAGGRPGTVGRSGGRQPAEPAGREPSRQGWEGHGGR